MSQRKPNPSKIRDGQINPQLLKKNDAGKVCVELPTVIYKDRFFPGFLKEEALDSATQENEKIHHLGFQFAFRKEGNYLNKIEIYWVLYRRTSINPNTHQSYFIRLRMRDNFGPDIKNPTGSTDFINLENGKFFSIEQYKTPALTHSHYDIASQPIESTNVKYNFNGMTRVGYKHFDFFGNNKDIDFVYFTCDQLRHFFEYYEKLIISGSQIVFGKQLTHRDDELLKNYEDNYFTLKIEGKDYKGSNLENITKLAAQDDEPTFGTEVATGQPCPPRWFGFTAILQQLNRIYSIPVDEVKTLSEAWNTIKYEERI